MCHFTSMSSMALAQHCSVVDNKMKIIDTLYALQNGLPAVIDICNIHNHSTESAAALYHLPATVDCREAFDGYYTSLLELNDDNTESQLADGSVNPKQTTVRWWHDEWRKKSLGPRTGSSVVTVCGL